MPGTINKYVDKLARANTPKFQEKKNPASWAHK